uniref:Uncharacterized protein n=1 Tax=Tanacetum cinerariifolium TaxID=118510 RepID=A0A699HKX6_TANCI|nr:hypothetical protein [Tanacetum cinerariifolium]
MFLEKVMLKALGEISEFARGTMSWLEKANRCSPPDSHCFCLRCSMSALLLLNFVNPSLVFFLTVPASSIHMIERYNHTD